jgi:hypothetical protein
VASFLSDITFLRRMRNENEQANCGNNYGSGWPFAAGVFSCQKNKGKATAWFE